MKNIMTMFAILTFSFSGMYGCCSSAQDQVLDTRVPRKIKSEQECLSVYSDILENSGDTPKGIERLKGQFKPSLKNLELGSSMPERYRIESPIGQFKPCEENLELGSPMPEQYENTALQYLEDHGLSIRKNR